MNRTWDELRRGPHGQETGAAGEIERRSDTDNPAQPIAAREHSDLAVVLRSRPIEIVKVGAFSDASKMRPPPARHLTIPTGQLSHPRRPFQAR
jgi:hypothetical protein